MKFSVFQVSRKGGRKQNEDRMGYCYTRESGLFLLADGMGGHPEGEVAAQLALQTFSALFQRRAHPLLDDPAEFLKSALLAAHHRIFSYANEKGMLDTPRTTLVAVIVQQSRATWIHCGDSRLYLVRDGELHSRTRDHSYAEHADRMPQNAVQFNRNVLFTCVGSPTRPIFDLGEPIALQQGDRLLLCSDGLWGNLTDADITEMLSRQTVSLSVPEMVDQALIRGGVGSDNVTAIAFEWETPTAAEDADGISTDELDEDIYASTIQADESDAEVELDEATIERSIAEINEAIRRSAARR